ncbi:MAG TPA: dihydropteroate synthase [Candidatus Limnocylindrales bacterium]|nr:dihydropteroate synthase [Candidatus Limnocylindrales bacterium]
MSVLHWGERTYVMGILNLTSDSFSGDGLAPVGSTPAEVTASALQQAAAFVEAGADILDVGAESSRPAQFYGEHAPLSSAAEARLAIPVVKALVDAFGARTMISIDTVKGSVARDALGAGAVMVNDVWAGRRDPGTLVAAAESNAYMVLMHNREMADYPAGVFDEVVSWLGSAIEDALGAGVAHERLIVDPGIGFGKTPEHSVELLHRLGELKQALGGLPMLVGTSRKRFIGELLGSAPPQDRLEGTAATVALAIAGGADIVRVHDLPPMMRTVKVTDGIVRWRP